MLSCAARSTLRPPTVSSRRDEAQRPPAPRGCRTSRTMREPASLCRVARRRARVEVEQHELPGDPAATGDEERRGHGGMPTSGPAVGVGPSVGGAASGRVGTVTTLADRTIAALRAEHDGLAEVVGGLDDDQLTGPSGASQWSVADVLSHLGSGAQIALAAVEAGLRGDAPPAGFNQSVWDRWNASAPRAQAIGFVQHDATLVQLLEGLDAAQRDALRVDLGRRRRVLPDVGCQIIWRSIATLFGIRGVGPRRAGSSSGALGWWRGCPVWMSGWRCSALICTMRCR